MFPMLVIHLPPTPMSTSTSANRLETRPLLPEHRRLARPQGPPRPSTASSNSAAATNLPPPMTPSPSTPSASAPSSPCAACGMSSACPSSSATSPTACSCSSPTASPRPPPVADWLRTYFACDRAAASTSPTPSAKPPRTPASRCKPSNWVVPTRPAAAQGGARRASVRPFPAPVRAPSWCSTTCSTYFEGLKLAQHGYSRDQRPRNPQLGGGGDVDDLPVSHTVHFAGNRRDSTTVRR